MLAAYIDNMLRWFEELASEGVRAFAGLIKEIVVLVKAVASQRAKNRRRGQ
jgi:hypothetical protein